MKINRFKTGFPGKALHRRVIDELAPSYVSRPVRHSVRKPVNAPKQERILVAGRAQSAETELSKITPTAVSKQSPIILQQPLTIAPAEDKTSGSIFSLDTNQFTVPTYQAPPRPRLVIGRRKKNKRIATRVVMTILTLIFIAIGTVTWRGYVTAGKVLSGTTTVAALSGENVAPTLLKGEGDGRVNILMLGVGGPGHDGGDLTDTMILASVDPVNYTVTLLSIPRDLWVTMPSNYFGTSQKINAAYSAGKYQYLGKADQANTNPGAIQAGLNSVDTVVSQVFGVRVDYHVLVNFAAFAQAVDTVDGVSIDVKKPLVDGTMAWENNNNATLVPAGLQQMDGKEALLYARSRHSTSDFDRSERQRQLLVALKQKVLTVGTFSNPSKLDGLAEAFGKNMYSDLSSKGALRLMSILKNVDDSKIQSTDLVTAPHSLVMTDKVGTSSVVRPKLGLNAYSDIQAYIRTQFRDGYLTRENATVVVVGKTEAQAIKTQAILKDYGYNVTGTQVGTIMSEGTSVVDLSGGKAPYTLNYLEKRYDTTATRSVPSGIVVPNGTQFVILVGT